MITWPSNLILSIARRRCVLFLGSGVSANSLNDRGVHPKTWRAFLEYALGSVNETQKRIIKKYISAYNYLMACELLRNYIGEDDFNRLLVNEYKSPGFHEADVHHHIFNLDARIVVSPNFDQIYDTFSKSESHNTILVKNYYDDDLIRAIHEDSRLILKIHGTIDTPDKLIFTQKDYANARVHYAGAYQILTSLLLTQPFLFIGTGLNDPDIRLLLENYRNQFLYSQNHYFVIPKIIYSSAELKIYEDSYKVHFIKYDPADSHKELIDSLNQLVIEVNAKREELAVSKNW